MSSVAVQQGFIDVRNIAEVYIRKTSSTDTYLTIKGRNSLTDTYATTTGGPNITISAITNSTFRGGTLAFRNCDAANVTIRDCVLIDNQVLVYKSNADLSGVSKFTGSRFSAILSIMSTITLSENISFVDNSAFRGGAMALYSSTLALSSGANIIFVNNSAQGEGGAIYVDPDFTRNLLLWVASIEPPCFYRLLNCREGASYNLHFVNNSATNGGEDIYGASLHTYCRHHNCTVTVNRVPSVSSDPTRVCVCDRDGQPRCTSESYIIMNRR
ncbi:MAG: hypothetical protein MJE68_18235, partial [Proteobacteria bacterium]|nr:hypothetical protein [Pseudomonadota bacterium]